MQTGDLVVLKENANPMKFNLGLEAEGRSKFPNCYDIIQPAIGKDGRWITGLDEDARSIRLIQDAEEREAKRQAVKALRLSLEDLTGYDLSGRSKFWDEFFVEINPKKPLDLTIPMDRVKYEVILASKGAAPSLKDTNNMDYLGSKYYVSRKHEDVSEKVSKQRRKAEADAAMLELLKTPDKAVLIGKYLQLPVSNSTPADNMFDIFKSYLDADDKLDSIKKFNIALAKTVDELSIKLIFDDGIKYFQVTHSHYHFHVKIMCFIYQYLNKTGVIFNNQQLLYFAFQEIFNFDKSIIE